MRIHRLPLLALLMLIPCECNHPSRRTNPMVLCDPSADSPCNERSECIENGDGIFRCECLPGFDGLPFCSDIDECQSSGVCNFAGAYCVDETPFYRCGCNPDEGYEYPPFYDGTKYDRYGPSECVEMGTEADSAIDRTILHPFYDTLTTRPDEFEDRGVDQTIVVPLLPKNGRNRTISVDLASVNVTEQPDSGRIELVGRSLLFIPTSSNINSDSFAVEFASSCNDLFHLSFQYSGVKAQVDVSVVYSFDPNTCDINQTSVEMSKGNEEVAKLTSGDSPEQSKTFKKRNGSFRRRADEIGDHTFPSSGAILPVFEFVGDVGADSIFQVSTFQYGLGNDIQPAAGVLTPVNIVRTVTEKTFELVSGIVRKKLALIMRFEDLLQYCPRDGRDYRMCNVEAIVWYFTDDNFDISLCATGHSDLIEQRWREQKLVEIEDYICENFDDSLSNRFFGIDNPDSIFQCSYWIGGFSLGLENVDVNDDGSFTAYLQINDPFSSPANVFNWDEEQIGEFLAEKLNTEFGNVYHVTGTWSHDFSCPPSSPHPSATPTAQPNISPSSSGSVPHQPPNKGPPTSPPTMEPTPSMIPEPPNNPPTSPNSPPSPPGGDSTEIPGNEPSPTFPPEPSEPSFGLPNPPALSPIYDSQCPGGRECFNPATDEGYMCVPEDACCPLEQFCEFDGPQCTGACKPAEEACDRLFPTCSVPTGQQCSPPEQCDASGGCYGDPHFITIDGMSYDFQGFGEYVGICVNIGGQGGAVNEDRNISLPDLCQPNKGNSTLQQNLQTGRVNIRTAPFNSRATVTVGVAVLDPGHANGTRAISLSINRDDSSVLVMDGDTVVLFGSSANGEIALLNSSLMIEKSGNEYVVRTSFGLISTVTHHGSFFNWWCTLPADLNGHAVGLLGFADGNRTNDLMNSMGQIVARADLFQEFGESWKVSSSNYSLFKALADFDTYAASDPDFVPLEGPPTATNEQLRMAREACMAIQDPTIRASCEYDILVAGEHLLAGFVDAALDFENRASMVSSNEPSVPPSDTLMPSAFERTNRSLEFYGTQVPRGHQDSCLLVSTDGGASYHFPYAVILYQPFFPLVPGTTSHLNGFPSSFQGLDTVQEFVLQWLMPDMFDDVQLYLAVNADDAATIFLNDGPAIVDFEGLLPEVNLNALPTFDSTSMVVPGMNTLRIQLRDIYRGRVGMGFAFRINFSGAEDAEIICEASPGPQRYRL